MAWDEDLRAFMEGLDAVPVTFAGAPSGLLGYQDFSDVDVLDRDGRGPVTTRQRTLLIPTTAAALLSEDMALTVGGTARTVIHPKALEDGAFTTVTIR